MAFTIIDDGDSGLSARTELNSIITYLNALGFQLQFSTDNSSWHYPWASGDLYMRLSGDFGVTYSDGIYLNYSASSASGWTSVVWDDTTGNLNFYKDLTLDFTVNLDGRYALSSVAKQATYTIVLQSGTSVADRLSKTVVKPTGWTLSTTGLDLVIEHNLDRYATIATIFATTSGVANQQLLNTAAHNGLLNASTDLLRIYSLASVEKEIRIFISFA